MYNFLKTSLLILSTTLPPCLPLSLYFPFTLSIRLLVGAPWGGFTRNRKGDVYKCPVSGPSTSCDELRLHGEQNLLYTKLTSVRTNYCTSGYFLKAHSHCKKEVIECSVSLLEIGQPPKPNRVNIGLILVRQWLRQPIKYQVGSQ